MSASTDVGRYGAPRCRDRWPACSFAPSSSPASRASRLSWTASAPISACGSRRRGRTPMARAKYSRSSTRDAPSGGDGVLDVTVVLLDSGYASTAILPIEVFHSAGVLWNWLHGEPQQPRFRVRVASIDGRRRDQPLLAGPDAAVLDRRHQATDIIILPASGRTAGRIARNTRAPALAAEDGMRGAPTSRASARAWHSLPKAGLSTAGRRPRTGPWPSRCVSAIPRFSGSPTSS